MQYVSWTRAGVDGHQLRPGRGRPIVLALISLARQVRGERLTPDAIDLVKPVRNKRKEGAAAAPSFDFSCIATFERI